MTVQFDVLVFWAVAPGRFSGDVKVSEEAAAFFFMVQEE